MHLEILVEDSSGEKLLNHIMPKILLDYNKYCTFRFKYYKGSGRIPANLKPISNPRHRVLLDQLPRLIKGYGKTPGIDALIIIVDTDTKDCREFLQDLINIRDQCSDKPKIVMFRLAIEEIEAWYLGDKKAIISAFPNAKINLIDKYIQDSVCGTWEFLVDVIYPGENTNKKQWPDSGVFKHECAEKIGPFMNIEDNVSPSFQKLRDGLRKILHDSLSSE